MTTTTATHDDPSAKRLSIAFLNWAHAIDHFVLLIYPTVVIGLEVIYGRPYSELIALSSTAFVAFGVFSLPAGWLAFVIPYVLHRLPAYWEEPERFDPERFSPERSANRPKFVYIPFGAGPRQCIGNHFALLEAHLIVATLAQRYRLRLVPGQRIEPWPLITLRPRFGMSMTIERRAGPYPQGAP